MINRDAPASADEALEYLEQAAGTLQDLHGDMEHVHRLATLGTLAASIAHEINNILTPVLGYAQLAKSDPGDADLQAKALDRAIAGVEAASTIAEAMLGFAQPSGRRNDPAIVKNVVDASLACMARKPDKDGIQLHTDVDPSFAVQMPPLSLQQVIINLLLNAFTALSGKRGEVYVTASAIDRDMMQITIADTGPGIPPAIERTLFEPFVSEGRPNAPRKGSGLGLAVCKHLIQAAGGTITVSTKLGEGTAFTLRLPAATPIHVSNEKPLDRVRSSKKAA